MSKKLEFTRRALLLGIGATTAGVALGSNLTVLAASPPTSEVHTAIAAFKAARRMVRKANARQDAIEAQLNLISDYDPHPRVQYGFFRKTMHEREPLYSYSHVDLKQRCANALYTAELMWGKAGADKTRDRYAALHRELSAKVRKTKGYERAAGMTEADKAVGAAYAMQDKAALALMLARPADAAEGRTKAAFMRGKPIFKAPWWESEELLSVILAHAAGA